MGMGGFIIEFWVRSSPGSELALLSVSLRRVGRGVVARGFGLEWRCFSLRVEAGRSVALAPRRSASFSRPSQMRLFVGELPPELDRLSSMQHTQGPRRRFDILIGAWHGAVERESAD